jgi:hypothetical protein
MCQLIGLPSLFRRDYLTESSKDFEAGFPSDEPRGFGLLMKPTKKAFLDFAHTLDKIISENINQEFFVKQGIESDEQIVRDGLARKQPKGKLRLLEEWLATRIRIRLRMGRR